VAVDQQLTDKQLDILHDHFKESFARLKEVEVSRDRLFLWMIGLFALLSVEIAYPAATGGSLGKLSIAGGELNLQALPLPALLTATWTLRTLTLAMGLRYCQKTVLANRQYSYLHSLEEAISPAVGGGDLYRREGRVYLKGYPLFLNVAWVAYVILFPLIVIVATCGLVWWELTRLQYPPLHRVLDTVIAFALITYFFLYSVPPGLAAQYRKWQARSSRKEQVAADPNTNSTRPTQVSKP
jgi:hypothetical protein